MKAPSDHQSWSFWLYAISWHDSLIFGCLSKQALQSIYVWTFESVNNLSVIWHKHRPNTLSPTHFMLKSEYYLRSYSWETGALAVNKRPVCLFSMSSANKLHSVLCSTFIFYGIKKFLQFDMVIKSISSSSTSSSGSQTGLSQVWTCCRIGPPSYFWAAAIKDSTGRYCPGRYERVKEEEGRSGCGSKRLKKYRSKIRNRLIRFWERISGWC